MRMSLLALLFLACSTTSSTLRTRFARERACSEDQVRVEDAGGNEYRVSGCEQHAVYVCGSTAGFGNPGASCAEQGVTGHAPPETAATRPLPLDPRIQEPR